MKSLFRKLFLVPFVAAIFAFAASAQGDPNPDSPQPLLLSGSDATRVLAVNTRGWDGSVPVTGGSVFRPSRTNSITIFLSNLALMSDEGVGSVRVYLTQQSGKTFELQTDELFRVDKRTHALQVRLFDPVGYRGQPLADGDSIIYVTWRGLMSNALRIGLGSMGGNIKVPAAPSFSPAGLTDRADYLYAGDRIRFLEQAAFGPSTAADAR